MGRFSALLRLQTRIHPLDELTLRGVLKPLSGRSSWAIRPYCVAYNRLTGKRRKMRLLRLP